MFTTPLTSAQQLSLVTELVEGMTKLAVTIAAFDGEFSSTDPIRAETERLQSLAIRLQLDAEARDELLRALPPSTPPPQN